MSRGNAAHDVRVFDDESSLGAAAAAWIAAELTGCVRANGHASFVLSGGLTPRTLYQLLGTRFKNDVPWARVHVFWGDERYVPHDHSSSNYRMAKETLLDAIDIAPSQVHPMPTHFSDPQEAARNYEATLARYFAGALAVFDVVLLGIGEDGHTASVFANSPAITAKDPVLAVMAPVEPRSRLTLTLPTIASASRIAVLVAGAAKSGALAGALGAGGADTPAAMLARTASGVGLVGRLPLMERPARGATR